ncbi:MAG: LacI family DNA-binding transcriptional regulator [Ferruginibacter sp.]
MKFEAVTIKDIAKALGISTSTVSRALRDSYEISAETKQLVLDCAEKLNYHPNPIALSLKEKRSRSIGVVVCEIANSFFSQVINGIESIAYDKGYNVIISQSHESYEREIMDLHYLSSRSVDGLLISLSTETNDMSHLQALHQKGLPIVMFDRVSSEINTHSVVVDNFRGAYEATELLINQGYKRIAAIANSEFLSITTERLAGYREALAHYGQKAHNGYIKHCFYGGMVFSEIEDAVNKLLTLQQKPDAILTTSDKLTTGCLKTLHRRGITVPDDIALVGFSNSDIAELLNPALTVVRQPAMEMGRDAIELLLQLIESKRPITQFEKRVLTPTLILGNSSALQPDAQESNKDANMFTLKHD